MTSYSLYDICFIITYILQADDDVVTSKRPFTSLYHRIIESTSENKHYNIQYHLQHAAHIKSPTTNFVMITNLIYFSRLEMLHS